MVETVQKTDSGWVQNPEEDPSVGMQKCNKCEMMVKTVKNKKESKLYNYGPMRSWFRLWVKTF